MRKTTGGTGRKAGSALHRSSTRGRQGARLHPVAAVCAGLLGGAFATGAQAQEQAPVAAQAPAPAASAPAPAPDTQQVVVTGIRASIESSINLKRHADSIVEAISAEDIGKLPDVSIAEAMSRLPGLAAQRVDGRAQVIAIRGLSPDFAATVLNGREQASTGTNRGVEFDQYPAELLSSVLVYKTPDATVMAQGVSGTVDLRTARPLDYHERTVALNVRGEHDSLGDLNHGAAGTSANGGRFSVSYIDQFADRTVGVAVGLAHLDAPGQELHYKAWGYQTDANCLAHQNDWGCHPITGQNPGDAYYMSGFEAEALSRRDKRDGLMGVLEYKPGADLHSTLDLYYSKFDQSEVMRGLMGSIGDGWGIPGSVFSNIGTTPVGTGSLVTSGSTTFVPNLVVRNDRNTRADELKSLGWNLEKKWGAWTAIADLSYSNARRQETLFETYAGTASSPTMAFRTPTGPGFGDFSFSQPLDDAATVALSDPAGWGHVGRLQDNTQDDTIRSANFHGQRRFEESVLSRVDFGVNLTRRDKTRQFDVFFASLNNGGTRQTLAPGDLLTPTSLSFVGVPAVLSYDPDAIAAKYYTMTRNLSGGPGGDLSKDFGVHEKVTTAYVKADLDTQAGAVPVHGNVGMQVVHTSQRSNAFAFDGSGAPIGTIEPGTTYNDFLPSLNATADLTSSTLLRLGLAKTLTRPRIDDMNASSSASVDPNTHTWSGSGGNPKLQPWRAWSADLSLEHYFGKRSYLAGAVFYKKLQTYIYQSTIGDYDFTGFINSTPSVVPVSNIGTYTTQANGKGGSMSGLELSGALDAGQISPALDGFGLEASTSLTRSAIKVNGPDHTDAWQTLPGLSRTVATLTAFYERGGWSFRVSDRYRSAYRGEYSSLFGSTSVLRTLSSNQVDLQAGYELAEGPAKGLQFTLQVVNANDEPDRNVQDGAGFGGVTAPQTFNVYGRQFLLGVSYKFH